VENGSSFRNAMEAVRHIADENPPWDDVLQTAKTVIGADASTLIMFNGQQDLLLLRQNGVDAAAEKEYIDHYYKQDALAQAALGSPSGRWWDSATLQSVSGARQHPFYADYMPRHRMSQVLAFVIVGEPERRAAVSFQRLTADPYAIEKVSQGKALEYTRALTKAIAARERIGARDFRAVELMLCGSQDAAFLVSTSGTLYRCTPKSHEMLGVAHMLAHSGRAITHAQERVFKGFLCALSRSAALQQRTRFAAPTSWGEGVRFDIAPSPAELKLADEPLLLVRMQRFSAFSAPEVNELIAFFSITHAEAKVLAERTVRNQIASLTKKMGCGRQAELVRLGALLQ
jgi:hypothetical protein